MKEVGTKVGPIDHKSEWNADCACCGVANHSQRIGAGIELCYIANKNWNYVATYVIATNDHLRSYKEQLLTFPKRNNGHSTIHSLFERNLASHTVISCIKIKKKVS